MMTATTPTQGTPPPRRAVRLLIDPLFGPFFWGKFLWSTGIWIHGIVAAIVVFDLTGSTLLVGATGAAQFAPQLLLSLVAGKFSDRGSPVRQIVIGESLCALGSAVLAGWIIVAGGTDHLPNAWPVIVSSLIVGLGLAIGGPSVQALLPALLRPQELAIGVELNTLPLTIARVVGPASGALLVARQGAAVAFIVAACGSVAFVLLVWLARPPRPPRHPDGTDFSVRAAIRHLRTDRPVVLLLIGVTAVGFGVDPSTTLAPALADSLNGGTDLVGQLTSSFGIGAGIGFGLVAPLRKLVGLGRLPSSGLLLIAIGLIGAAVGTHEPLALASFGLSGVGMTVALTSLSTQVHQRTPDLLRGRIMALWMMGFLGSRPLAGLMSGSISDNLSVSTAFATTAAIVAVVAWLCRPSRIAVRQD